MWSSRSLKEDALMKSLICLFVVGLLFFSLPAWAAEDFDGTKTLLCASVEAIGCEPGESCEKGLPESFGAPQFMRVDFGKKVIVGPKRTTEIRLMEKSDDQITLQGSELGFGWAFILDRETGKMTVTLAGMDSAFVIFGACTTLQ
jgi:hypothetical protein